MKFSGSFYSHETGEETTVYEESITALTRELAKLQPGDAITIQRDE